MIFKLQLNNEIYRINNQLNTFKELQDLISQRFSDKLSPSYFVQYKDSDGDWVRISGEEDFEILLEDFKAIKTVKLIIIDNAGDEPSNQDQILPEDKLTVDDEINKSFEVLEDYPEVKPLNTEVKVEQELKNVPESTEMEVEEDMQLSKKAKKEAKKAQKQAKKELKQANKVEKFEKFLKGWLERFDKLINNQSPLIVLRQGKFRVMKLIKKSPKQYRRYIKQAFAAPRELALEFWMNNKELGQWLGDKSVGKKVVNQKYEAMKEDAKEVVDQLTNWLNSVKVTLKNLAEINLANVPQNVESESSDSSESSLERFRHRGQRHGGKRMKRLWRILKQNLSEEDFMAKAKAIKEMRQNMDRKDFREFMIGTLKSLQSSDDSTSGSSCERRGPHGRRGKHGRRGGRRGGRHGHGKHSHMQRRHCHGKGQRSRSRSRRRSRRHGRRHGSSSRSSSSSNSSRSSSSGRGGRGHRGQRGPCRGPFGMMKKFFGGLMGGPHKGKFGEVKRQFFQDMKANCTEEEFIAKKKAWHQKKQNMTKDEWREMKQGMMKKYFMQMKGNWHKGPKNHFGKWRHHVAEKVQNKIDFSISQAIPQIAQQVAQILKAGENEVSNELPRLERITKAKKAGLPIHFGFVCDGCNTRPIIGDLYKCSVLKDFDYCSTCEATKPHKYPFLKIRNPKQRPSTIFTMINDEEGQVNHKFIKKCKKQFQQWVDVMKKQKKQAKKCNKKWNKICQKVAEKVEPEQSQPIEAEENVQTQTYQPAEKVQKKDESVVIEEPQVVECKFQLHPKGQKLIEFFALNAEKDGPAVMNFLQGKYNWDISNLTNAFIDEVLPQLKK